MLRSLIEAELVAGNSITEVSHAHPAPPVTRAQPPSRLTMGIGAGLAALLVVVAVYFFWRGHGLPGGGFVAGLVTAVALVMQYMALGQQRADTLLGNQGGRRYTLFIALGLAIATATGLGSFAFDHPYLSSASGHPVVALLGELPLATAALFDLGVYLTVVASTLLTLSALGAASQSAAAAQAAPASGQGGA